MPEWNELYTTISNGEVLTPDDDGYAASLRRWSKAAEVNSVSQAPGLLLTTSRTFIISI